MKKMIKVVLTLIMALCIILGVNMGVTYAAMEPGSFEFSFWGERGDTISYSTWQWKDNDSSCEIEYYDSGAYDVIMSIIAHDGDDYVEDIQVQEKIYSPGQRETIYNWVRESGYERAAVKGESTVDSLYYADGIWIPDTRE